MKALSIDPEYAMKIARGEKMYMETFNNTTKVVRDDLSEADFDEEDIFFSSGETTFQSEGFSGLVDFELIYFMVVM